MLYLVTGASGSGKTACLDILRQRNPQVVWYDFDEVGVPADADKRWRHRTTEYWSKRASENQAKGLDICISGNIILGEVLACPSALEITRLAVCLLDCADVVRIDACVPEAQTERIWRCFVGQHGSECMPSIRSGTKILFAMMVLGKCNGSGGRIGKGAIPGGGHMFWIPPR